MIHWFWKNKPLMRRLPVLMALLAGFMFVGRPVQTVPGGKAHIFAGKFQTQQPFQADEKAPAGEELPVFEPGYLALAQVAPLQIFLYQQAILPVLTPIVEIVEQAPASVPDLVNSFHRILFRRIISPNAP